MASNDLELAFYGELLSGFDELEVKQNMAAMFKASVEQMERMFTGGRVVIRNKLDFETAQKYVQAMAKRGAVCKVEMMGQPGVEASSPEVKSQDVVSTAAPSRTDIPGAASPAKESSSVVGSESPEPAAGNKTKREGIDVAGEKVDEILQHSGLTLDPVGIRLSEVSAPVAEPELSDLEGIDLLPPGSPLVDKKEELPVSVPDTSHISLSDDKDTD